MTTLNGCHNHPPFVDTLTVMDRHASYPAFANKEVRVFITKEIPNVMSRDCTYSKNVNDPKCSGCTWNEYGKK